jgi:hypothetical protein
VSVMSNLLGKIRHFPWQNSPLPTPHIIVAK